MATIARSIALCTAQRLVKMEFICLNFSRQSSVLFRDQYSTYLCRYYFLEAFYLMGLFDSYNTTKLAFKIIFEITISTTLI